MKDNCKNCPVKHFVHANEYCSQCPLKQKPSTGFAYLFKNGKSECLASAEFELPMGFINKTVELMPGIRIEFIGDE